MFGVGPGLGGSANSVFDICAYSCGGMTMLSNPWLPLPSGDLIADAFLQTWFHNCVMLL